MQTNESRKRARRREEVSAVSRRYRWQPHRPVPAACAPAYPPAVDPASRFVARLVWTHEAGHIIAAQRSAQAQPLPGTQTHGHTETGPCALLTSASTRFTPNYTELVWLLHETAPFRYASSSENNTRAELTGTKPPHNTTTHTHSSRIVGQPAYRVRYIAGAHTPKRRNCAQHGTPRLDANEIT